MRPHTHTHACTHTENYQSVDYTIFTTGSGGVGWWRHGLTHTGECLAVIGKYCCFWDSHLHWSKQQCMHPISRSSCVDKCEWCKTYTRTHSCTHACLCTHTHAHTHAHTNPAVREVICTWGTSSVWDKRYCTETKATSMLIFYDLHN